MGSPPALEVDLLRTFAIIAEGGSFTRAAERVGRTQAAMSLQMRRLEALAGAELFVRTRGGAPRLTAKGAHLLERAQEVVTLNDDIVLSLKTPSPLTRAEGFMRRPTTSVLVRPIRNMSGDPGQDYLAQGIEAATLGALSHMRWLRVIADDGGTHGKPRAMRWRARSRGKEAGCA